MLTEQDSGREVDAAVGEQVQVTLKENPTAGYGWKVASLTPGVLELEGSRFSLPAGTGVGGGGRRTFTFRAAAGGRAVLELELRRPWERDVPPEARFSLTVHVR
jgi:inhibitor of cysteine peptidase